MHRIPDISARLSPGNLRKRKFMRKCKSIHIVVCLIFGTKYFTTLYESVVYNMHYESKICFSN